MNVLPNVLAAVDFLKLVDPAVIAIYLIGITAFGIWIGYRRNTSSQQYFLANKSLGWFTVGAAVFTSNISTLHLVGLAAGGAENGMVIGNFEWMACFTLIALALVFAPFYINSKVSTCRNSWSGAIARRPARFSPSSVCSARCSFTSESACLPPPKYLKASSACR